MGAHLREHQGVAGASFAVWAPSAQAVRVVGDFNGWDGRMHPMRMLGSSGVWELFVPAVEAGHRYKFELVAADGSLILKTDPFAFATEVPPEHGRHHRHRGHPHRGPTRSGWSGGRPPTP